MKEKVSSKYLIRKIKRQSLTLLSRLLFSRIKLPQKQSPSDLSSIIIFVQEKIGDALLLTPLIQSLVRYIPKIQISLLCFSDASYGFFQNDNHIAACYHIKLYNLLQITRLRKIHFDILFNPKDHPSNTFLLLSCMIRAKNKIAVYHELHQGFYNRLLKLSFETHIIKKNLSLLSELGFEPQAEDLIPYLNDQSCSSQIQDIANSISSAPLAINLSAGEADRKWDLAKWKELIENTDKDIIILCMPSELPEKLALEAKYKHVIPTVSTRNLYEVHILLTKCSVLITPDTSLVHLSLISNTPVLGLYRFDPIHHKRFAPLTAHSRKLVSISHTIASIPSSDVLNSLKGILDEIKA